MKPSRYRGVEKTQKEINDVLDKIRAEIKQLPYQRIFGNVSSYSLLDTVVEIIDKYKTESEPQERSDKE